MNSFGTLFSTSTERTVQFVNIYVFLFNDDIDCNLAEKPKEVQRTDNPLVFLIQTGTGQTCTHPSWPGYQKCPD